jgi:hypothetical protein
VSSYRLIEAEKTSFPIQLMCPPHARGLEEWLLRLERPSAFQKESRGYRPHREGSRDPPAQQGDLRLSEGPRRVEGARDPLRS